MVEVRCTDTLLALDALLDEAAPAGGDGVSSEQRRAVRDAMDRVRRVAAALARVKEAAASADD